MDVSKEAASSRHSRSDAHVNSQRLAGSQDLHRFNLNKIPAQRWGCGPQVPSLVQNLFATDTHRDKKKNQGFSTPWNVTGYINHTPGEVPCQGVAVQHKTDSMLLCECFLICYFFFSYSLFWPLFLRDREREREHEVER